MNWFITPEEMAEHRADAQSRMGAANQGSDALIRRDTGRTKADGIERTTWTTIHASEPCRLRGQRGTGPSVDLTSGGVDITRGRRELHFRHDLPDLRTGDVVELIAGAHRGSFWKVDDDAPGGDQQTAYRVPVIATTRPRDWP